jgi:spore coat polysaccharide biosynthesis predicted glycosyltransferase SpsG
MLSLAGYLRNQNKNLEIDFATNDRARVSKILKEDNFNLLDLNQINNDYDVALYDSVQFDEDVLKKLRSISKKTIAFDFFNYNTVLVDRIINLYNHFPEKRDNFYGIISDGVEYAILNENIIDSRCIKFKNNSLLPYSILVTFGGEDPCGNTLLVLKYLYELNLTATVLIGKLNKSKEKIRQIFKDKFKIVDQVNNMEEYYSTHKLIICGGGTTLLEAIFLGRPTIAVPQNNFESDFIDNIKQKIKIFALHEILDIIGLLDDSTQMDLLSDEYQSLIDGKGKERIEKIIYEITE